MAPYWYVSGFLLLLSLFELALKKDERTSHILTYLLCIATVMLIVFGGIRGLGTGMDDYQYRSFFEDFIRRIEVNGFLNTVAFFRYEPLIFAIAWITSLFSHNASAFLFVFSILAVGTNAIFFKKMSPYPILALVLYSAHIFINKDVNQIRFGLSSAFFLGVVWTLYLKRYWLAFGFFILSFISHNTAVMVVTLIPFLFIRERRWFPIAIIVLSIPASKVGGMGFVTAIAGHLGGLGERAAGYNNDNAAGETGSVFSISNLKNVMLVFIFVYFMLTNQMKRDNYPAWRLNYLLVLTFAIGGAIRIFFYNYPSGARLSNYLLQVEPIVLTLLIYQSKRVWKPAMFAMFIFFQVYYLYYNTISLKQAVMGYEVAREFKLIH
ncbi:MULTISPECIES: EpsG family protein [unclassified Pantoea]|uniref:EpsG family protein n=1 Tax=unclassified Pantoea TaxID=2630326 RepID=UPI0001E0C282|nr:MULTISPECIES: EpsG family protein [unclassified Pantoea]EFM19419.1 exopolysaccharide biosynthesis protein [Pantoea sp. aB]QNQ59975.1 EpsG family protein [Pantoea sp. MT58]